MDFPSKVWAHGAEPRGGRPICASVPVRSTLWATRRGCAARNCSEMLQRQRCGCSIIAEFSGYALLRDCLGSNHRVARHRKLSRRRGGAAPIRSAVSLGAVGMRRLRTCTGRRGPDSICQLVLVSRPMPLLRREALGLLSADRACCRHDRHFGGRGHERCHVHRKLHSWMGTACCGRDGMASVQEHFRAGDCATDLGTLVVGARDSFEIAWCVPQYFQSFAALTRKSRNAPTRLDCLSASQ